MDYMSCGGVDQGTAVAWGRKQGRGGIGIA